jgi:hypothetical protein
VHTLGPEVADVNARAGFAPDPQQELILDLTFAVRPDGSPASFEVCVICARQNLKTGSLKQITIGWLYVLNVPEVMWTSHEMSTTIEAQDDLADLIIGGESPYLRSRVLRQKNQGIYTDNGSERLELRDPRTGLEQTVMFKARRGVSGRGLARPKLILDEAFALSPRMLGSLLPTMTATRNAQVVYASSPGMAVVPGSSNGSEALFEIRDRGTKGTSAAMTYVEWNSPKTECDDPDCAHPKDWGGQRFPRPEDRGCALNRVELWEKANPTLSTGRITLERLADLRQALPSEEFARESLAWWEDDDVEATGVAIDMTLWGHLGAKRAPASRRVAVVLDVEPDESAATIGVAGDGPGGRALLAVHTGPGLTWVVDRVKNLRANTEVLELALHHKRTATLATRLTAERIPFEVLTAADPAAGCSTLLQGLAEGTVTHLEQDELTTAAALARTRMVNEVQVWDRRDRDVHIGAVVAAATALHRYRVLTAKPRTPPPSPLLVSATERDRPDDIDISTAGF